LAFVAPAFLFAMVTCTAQAQTMKLMRLATAFFPWTTTVEKGEKDPEFDG